MIHDLRQPVAVLGGGLAGLTAACTLRRLGVPVIVFEAGRQIAGMAASFHDSDGFTYDFGAHFITNRLAAAVGVGAECRDVRHYGERVLLDGRSYSYPFGLLANPSFAIGGLRSRLGGSARAEPRTAAEAFTAAYGRPLAERVAIPLVESWSGLPADQLSASVAGKLQNGILRTVFLNLASRVTGRAVACGYSHEQPENPWVWHVYPMGGLAVLCRRLAANLDGCLRLETPIERILVEDDRVVGVRAKGQDMAVSAVVSTAPVNVLARLISGSDALAGLARFAYRPMVFVNLRFTGRGLLPDTVLWTPEPQFPFLRLTETTLSMPWLAPEGKTIVTVDIGCSVGDEIWTMPDEALAERCVNDIVPIVPDARSRYLGGRVLRTPIAYPIHRLDYETERRRFAEGTGIQGLHSIGRHGEFAHILMEDIYWRTRAKMIDLATRLPNPALAAVA